MKLTNEQAERLMSAIQGGIKLKKEERRALKEAVLEDIREAQLKLLQCRAGLDEAVEAIRVIIDYPIGYEDGCIHEALLFFLNHFHDVQWEAKQCRSFLQALEKKAEEDIENGD